MHPLTTFGAGPTMHCSVRKCAPETEASSMQAKTFGAGQRSCMGNFWTPNPNRGPRVPCGALSAPGPLPPPLQLLAVLKVRLTSVVSHATQDVKAGATP